MTTFTKAANIIFRGTIAAALGATVLQIAHAAGALQNTAAGNAFSGIMGQGQLVTIALAAAIVLSILARKCGSQASMIVRTISLTGLAGLAAIAADLFKFNDILARSASGAATVSEMAAAKQVMNALGEYGYTQADAAKFITIGGTVISVIIAAALAILTITSIVSIVKTVKAQRTVKALAYAA